jgi:hypothetical protein
MSDMDRILASEGRSPFVSLCNNDNFCLYVLAMIPALFHNHPLSIAFIFIEERQMLQKLREDGNQYNTFIPILPYLILE